MTKGDDRDLLRRLAGETARTAGAERPVAAGAGSASASAHGPGARGARAGAPAGGETAAPESPPPSAGVGRAELPADHLPRLAALWAALEPPAAEPAPPGFTGRVMARVREEARGRETLGRRFGVLPGRLAAASALSAGLVAGAGLGVLIAVPAGEGDGGRPAAVAARAEHGTEAAGRQAGAPADPAGAEAPAAVGEGEGVTAERPPGGVAVAEGGTAAGAAGGDTALDDDALLAAAVAAAAGEPAGEAPDELDAVVGAEPDLAGDYLAALAALGEAS